MSFEWRYAGSMDENPVHAGRRSKPKPAKQVVSTYVDCNNCNTYPKHPLEKVVWVSRPAPKPDIANLATVGWVSLELTQLSIASRFPSDPAQQNHRADNLCNTECRVRIVRGQRDRKDKNSADRRLCLEKPEQSARRVGAPFLDQVAISRIVNGNLRSLCNV